MEISFKTLELKKLFPLAISRGTSVGSRNLYVFVRDGDHVGIGECAPGTGSDEELASAAEHQLKKLIDTDIRELSIHDIVARGVNLGIDEPALAGLDIALWDLLAKKANLPLYRMFGLGKPVEHTSVTIGINPPDVMRERVPKLLSTVRTKSLKIKLGSPEGVEADRDSYEAAREASRDFHVKLRVDANGGWSVADARHMIRWLSERGCEYVEQPLAQGQELDLPEIFRDRPLPIFLDESIRTSKDVAKLALHCDGINLKLMKTGGLTEALRVVATARAHRLQTMIGCMGESSVSIGAGAAIGGLFDYIDLDSHLNLDPDPAEGLKFVSGVVMPRDEPGLGVKLKPEFADA
jgi:L-alanine-DL-glutamate epimerase-like enolase superfamily enzyme